MTTPPPISKVAQVAAELRRYVAAHPHAADTLQGVARWWLASGPGTALSTEIETALEELVSDGTIDRRQLPDGSILYLARAP